MNDDVKGERKMTFKEITRDDVEEMAVMYTESFSTPPWNEPWTVDISKKRLTQMINCEGFYGLLAYEADTLVGLILGNTEHSFKGLEFYIKEFCTIPAVQGKGVGSQLLTEFEARLVKQGVAAIYLITAKGDPTEGFYTRRQYQTDQDWILMRK